MGHTDYVSPRARGSTSSGRPTRLCRRVSRVREIYHQLAPITRDEQWSPRVRGDLPLTPGVDTCDFVSPCADLPRRDCLCSIGARPPAWRGSTRSGPVGVDPVMIPAAGGSTARGGP